MPNYSSMDQTQNIKWIATGYLLVSIVSLLLSFYLESSLPEPLVLFLEAELERDLTKAEYIVLFLSIPLAILHLVSIYGLIRIRGYAKTYFIVSMIGLFIVSPFIGPYVEHGLAWAVGGVATVLSGGLLALLLFTNSAFNKRGLVGTATACPNRGRYVSERTWR